ncbi:MAG: DNA internalization-related competence protein ComEC/Rec2 [Lachnospiraceae bacterium]|nr:DNA internalization-related competence protein ComEC/Rec2 [Lachnospiraceae bacterium]
MKAIGRLFEIRRPMCVLSFVFIFLVFVVTNLTGGVDEAEYVRNDKAVWVCGKVTDKVSKNGVLSIHLTNCYISEDTLKPSKNTFRKLLTKNKRMIIYVKDGDSFDVKIGQLISAKGAYSNFQKPENDGQFNMRRHYRIRGYEGAIKNAKVYGRSHKYSMYRQFLFDVKEHTKELYKYYIDDEEAGALSAMVLGDKSFLDEDIKDIYQTAGISHILSLSGLHIAAVGMSVFTIMSAIGLGVFMSSAVSVVLIVSYGILTGLSTSTVRALTMFLLALLAKNIGRTYDILSALCLSSILILFEMPYYVYDAGFLLSFTSVIGIALIYPILDDATDQGERNKIRISFLYKIRKTLLYEKIRQSICVSLAAMLATLPVTVNTFYKISRYGVIINIIVVPLMSAVLGVGIIASIIGNIIGKYRPFKLITWAMLTIAEKILVLYKTLSISISNIPGNIWITGRSTITRNLVYITTIIILCLIHKYYKKTETSQNSIYKYKLITVILIIFSIGILTGKNHMDYSINVLSVGQGACNILYGKNVPTVIIDGGSIDVKNVGKYRIIPFIYSNGIDEIDYLFVTHNDSDHISGIKELISDRYSGIRIKNIFLSAYDEEIVSLAHERKININYMKKGDYIDNNGFLIQCINPVEKTESVEDANDNSLVLKISYKGFEALFTGDISSDVERKIIDYGDDISADFMTVAHHGSRFSNSSDFITGVNAKIYTISAGENNSYGHPHKETLERLGQRIPDAKILRTDESGQITVIVDKGETSIYRFLDEN